MRRFDRAVCVSWILVVSSAQAPLPSGAWRISEAPAELRQAISRADLVVISMQDALLRELTAALDKGGPAFAIQSCHIDVVGAIRRIERGQGVTAGRTSDRLRNPANAPRRWAAPLVAANAGRMARDVEGFAVDLGNAVGVLRPIAELPACRSCHGPAGTIDPRVKAALTARYPTDRAIDFNDGEIRGWFWVEVPKTLH